MFGNLSKTLLLTVLWSKHANAIFGLYVPRKGYFNFNSRYTYQFKVSILSCFMVELFICFLQTWNLLFQQFCHSLFKIVTIEGVGARGRVVVYPVSGLWWSHNLDTSGIIPPKQWWMCSMEAYWMGCADVDGFVTVTAVKGF